MMRTLMVALVATVVAVAGVASVLTYLYVNPTHSGKGSATVRLSIVQTSSGEYLYNTSSIHVPAHETVRITITNYDPGNHSADWRYCNVSGTIGGMMNGSGGWSTGPWSMNGSGGMGMGPWKNTGSGGMGPWAMDGRGGPGFTPVVVSHTFSVIGHGFGLNVPIPSARSASDPAMVSFTIDSLGPGMVDWTCEAHGMDIANGTVGGMMGSWAEY